MTENNLHPGRYYWVRIHNHPDNRCYLGRLIGEAFDIAIIEDEAGEIYAEPVQLVLTEAIGYKFEEKNWFLRLF